MKIKKKDEMYISKKCYAKKHVDLLLLLCVIILQIVVKNIFRRYCSQAFNTEEILKCHIKGCFKINGKERVIMPQNANMLISKIMRE